MKTSNILSAVASVIDSIEYQCENAKCSYEISQKEYDGILSEIRENASGDEDYEYELENNWRLKNAKNALEKNQAELLTWQNLKEYVFANIQKVTK